MLINRKVTEQQMSQICKNFKKLSRLRNMSRGPIPTFIMKYLRTRFKKLAEALQRYVYETGANQPFVRLKFLRVFV